MNLILIIDDDPILNMLLSGILKKSGYDVITANDGHSGLKAAFAKKPDVIITDYQMPDLSGMEVLAELKKQSIEAPVIMLTAHGDVSLTIKSIQNGAFDYIEKPVNPKEILQAIANGLQSAERSRSRKEAHSSATRRTLKENILVGKDPVMRDIFKNVGRVSLNKVNVLISGETGTGKERVARLIHYSGISREHPIITVNCNAVSDEELKKELFGAKDARTRSGIRSGKLEQVGLGTIYLKEVTRLSVILQAKLLEMISNSGEDEIGRPLLGPGFTGRIIASTSFNLAAKVEEGTFLKELYYRLNEFIIKVPPLRERKGDIPELINTLLEQLCRSLDKRIEVIDEDVIPHLEAYSWPGNIRELKNILTQAVIFSHGGVLQKKHIIIPKPEVAVAEADNDSVASLEEIEKNHISKVLSITKWSKQETAALLGITRPTLNAKIEKYGIMPE